MMAFIDQEANEKAEEIDAKVRIMVHTNTDRSMSLQFCPVICLIIIPEEQSITAGYTLLFLYKWVNVTQIFD